MTEQQQTFELEAPAPQTDELEAPLWRVVLETGRFGDWVHTRAATEQEAIRGLTRWQRKHVGHVRRVMRTSDWDRIRQEA